MIADIDPSSGAGGAQGRAEHLPVILWRYAKFPLERTPHRLDDAEATLLSDYGDPLVCIFEHMTGPLKT